MAKVNTAAYKTFDDICGRLDEIIGQVRDKDTSLERSLDLFDEAIALGSKAVDMVDSTDYTAEEEEKLVASQKRDEAAGGEDGESSPDAASGTGADGVGAAAGDPDAVAADAASADGQES